MKPLYSFHAWLADHVKWVQYPNVTALHSYTREAPRTGYRFKNKMPIGDRIDLIVINLFLLVIGLIATGAVLLILYLFISALL